ncbi:Protein kinase domain [Pelomyxa schiedti]|nr:Protein kinase domain [Pelomyxa schiedti]
MRAAAPYVMPRPDPSGFEPSTFPAVASTPGCPSTPTKRSSSIRDSFKTPKRKLGKHHKARSPSTSPTSPTSSLPECGHSTPHKVAHVSRAQDCIPTSNNAALPPVQVPAQTQYGFISPSSGGDSTASTDPFQFLAQSNPITPPSVSTNSSLMRLRARAIQPTALYTNGSGERKGIALTSSLRDLTERHSIMVLGDHVLKITNKPQWNNKLIAEARMMLLLIGQPHCVHIFDVWKEGNLACLAMEAGGRSLHQIIHDRSSAILDDEFWNYAIDIALGLREMLDKYIAHMDVKPRNLVECKEGCLIFIDFGQSLIMPCFIPDDVDALGDGAYLTPEFNTKHVTPAWDAFSYGITCLEMISRADMRTRGLRDFLLSCTSPEVFFSKFPEAQNRSPEILHFVWRLIRPNPQERMTVIQVLADPSLQARIQARCDLAAQRRQVPIDIEALSNHITECVEHC